VDGVMLLLLAVALVVMLGILSVGLGVDSRDGYVADRASHDGGR
jgi:hypothetical protein